jgi:hypothetical protein
MRVDFSWDRSAKKYEQVYDELAAVQASAHMTSPRTVDARRGTARTVREPTLH